MSWFGSSKKNDSELHKLSNMIFEKSLLCAEDLKPDLEEKFGKDSKEFHAKYIPVLFEFMYFFLHLTNRSALFQLGYEKQKKLYGVLAPLVIDNTARTLCALYDWPINLKDGIKADFNNNMNSAELDYCSCVELLLDPKDDTPVDEKIDSGVKSKSMVGQLTDNLSRIIKGEININAFFAVLICGLVMKSLRKKDLQVLVLKASNEIN